MTYDTAMSVIEFSSFEPNIVFSDPSDPDELRRYTVLLDQGPARNGAQRVRKVANTQGETFALKALRALGPSDPNDPGRSVLTPSAVKSFYEEYRNQLVVSCLGGFAKAYGYGHIGSVPAILMEWIEGPSLCEAVPELCSPTRDGRVPARAVASIGKTLGEILLAAQNLDSPFAHRDISLRNILVRTERSPLARQIERSRFELCFVDLGSSSFLHDDPSFTMRSGIWRKGTPEFAPPEMLTGDIPELAPLRTSPSIDTYELCSVLYTLLSGHTPYRLSERLEGSPYLYKTEHRPDPLSMQGERNQAIAKIIMGGIHNEQSRRTPLAELVEALDAWLEAFGPEA